MAGVCMYKNNLQGVLAFVAGIFFEVLIFHCSMSDKVLN